MKNIVMIVAVLVSLLSFSSCKKSIDVEPVDGFEADIVFRNFELGEGYDYKFVLLSASKPAAFFDYSEIGRDSMQVNILKDDPVWGPLDGWGWQGTNVIGLTIKDNAGVEIALELTIYGVAAQRDEPFDPYCINILKDVKAVDGVTKVTGFTPNSWDYRDCEPAKIFIER